MINPKGPLARAFAATAIVALLAGSAALTSYTGRDYLADKSDTLRLNPFVEPDFPFISTSVDARKLGKGFPTDNIAARTLAIRLGDSAYACFDTDLLRWSVAWTGKFLPMVQMAQISYNDFFNKNNKITTVTGHAKIANGLYPGWIAGKPEFLAQRLNEPNWKPISIAKGHWDGIHVDGEQVVLNYHVGQTAIEEVNTSASFGSQTAFIRSFKTGAVPVGLSMAAAEVTSGVASNISKRIAVIYQNDQRDTVTAVGIVGKSNITAGVIDNQLLTLAVSQNAAPQEGTVAIWKGPAAELKAFEKFCKKYKMTFPAYKQGGKPHWSQPVITKGVISPDTAAFVTDKLTLPLANPWKRNVRIADISFFKDGRAAVVTFEGDVWIVSGIDRNLERIQWKRYASGLNEPMSVEVVKDTVYIFGREGIVRLHDLNKDGEADFYENFSNIMSQSPESREWAGDLVHAPDGSFYIAKGGSLDNGPGVTGKAAKGFRTGSDQNGTIMRIFDEGKKMEVIATGLRGPYLGLHPATGTLTATDQQGNFVPSSPVYLVKKGDYFGVEPTMHRTDNPPIARPLAWIPHNIDRSSLGHAWVTSNKMGPLNGNLIHFSFGEPSLFRVVVDSASKTIQGGVAMIKADYPAPTNKGVVNQTDGNLYVTGFNLWGSGSTGLSALLRLRYTGKPSYMASFFRAGKEGIVLGFDSPLDANSVADLTQYKIKRWNYKRTEEYGSGHFKLDGSSGEETLFATGAYLSADKKKILLLIPGMEEVEQMEIAYRLKAADGQPVNNAFWFTVNDTGKLNYEPYRFGAVDLALLDKKIETPAASKEEPATIARGKDLFTKMACVGCHSEGTKTDGYYGPPFQHLYKSERVFEDGSKAIADEAYIRESILKPAAKVVKGYSPEMPSFEGVLSDSDIASVSMYIKSLKK